MAQRLGVFQVAGFWKLYSEEGEARTFETRREALLCGELIASEAAAPGHPIELYIQDASGEVRTTTSFTGLDGNRLQAR